MTVLINPYVNATGGGGGLPTPYAAAADLLIWYRSDQGMYSDAGITPATTNGSNVYQWNDLSGNANHAVRAVSGHTPTLITGALNGESVLNFASGNQYYTLPFAFDALTAGEAFLVLQDDDDPPPGGRHNGIWHLGNQFGNPSLLTAGDSNWYEAFGSTTRYLVGNPTPSLSSTYRVANVYSASNDWQAFLDGSSLHTETTNTVQFPATGESSAYLGASAGAAFQHYGRIAEFLFYGVKLGSTDRATVTAALGARYGLF